jgi:hypothetical protein
MHLDFGQHDSVTLVYKCEENGQRLRRYRSESASTGVLQLFAFDGDGKVKSALTENFAHKSAAKKFGG